MTTPSAASTSAKGPAEGSALGVSAAEKYAELEARGEERKKCECHGEHQYWSKDARGPAGGYWRCAFVVRVDAAQRRKDDPEKYREIHRRYRKKNWEHRARQSLRYRKTHLEELRAKYRAQYASDPEKYREKTRKWREVNPDYVRPGIQIRVSGIDFYYPVPKERREEVKRLLADFRANQIEEYREASANGWIDTAKS